MLIYCWYQLLLIIIIIMIIAIKLLICYYYFIILQEVFAVGKSKDLLFTNNAYKWANSTELALIIYSNGICAAIFITFYKHCSNYWLLFNFNHV